MTKTKLLVGLIVSFVAFSQAQEVSTERLTVEADRVPDAEAAAPFSVTAFDREDLGVAPELRLLTGIMLASVPLDLRERQCENGRFPLVDRGSRETKSNVLKAPISQS